MVIKKNTHMHIITATGGLGLHRIFILEFWGYHMNLVDKLRNHLIWLQMAVYT